MAPSGQFAGSRFWRSFRLVGDYTEGVVVDRVDLDISVLYLFR